jgi:hypothetical protein
MMKNMANPDRGFSAEQFGQHLKPSLTLSGWGRLSNEAHGITGCGKLVCLKGTAFRPYITPV